MIERVIIKVMPLSLKPHIVSVVKNPMAEQSRYKFVAVCSCQWQCLCPTEEAAKSWAYGHLRRWEPEASNPFEQIKIGFFLAQKEEESGEEVPVS